MMIDKLIEDMYSVLDGKEGGYSLEEFKAYGEGHKEILKSRLSPRDKEGGRLRLSNIGKPCSRQLWYEQNPDVQGEALRSNTKLKFLYGDLVELLLLEMVRKSGHLVEGEQGEIFVNGIRGHRDCIIDGMLVDVKSASSYSFKKFEDHLDSNNDSFGYLTQLGSYLLGSQNDPLVEYKNEAAFLVIDKVNGDLCLDRHTFTEEDFEKIYNKMTQRKKELTPDMPLPDRSFISVPEGKSGNRKLGVNCSYCPFKGTC